MFAAIFLFPLLSAGYQGLLVVCSCSVKGEGKWRTASKVRGEGKKKNPQQSQPKVLSFPLCAGLGASWDESLWNQAWFISHGSTRHVDLTMPLSCSARRRSCPCSSRPLLLRSPSPAPLAWKVLEQAPRDSASVQGVWHGRHPRFSPTSSFPLGAAAVMYDETGTGREADQQKLQEGTTVAQLV